MARVIGAAFRAAQVGIVLAATLASCASGYDAKADGPVYVADAWVRPTNVTATGAMYLTLENKEAATVVIVGAATPFARAAEFHESMEMQGMSHMNKLDSRHAAKELDCEVASPPHAARAERVFIRTRLGERY